MAEMTVFDEATGESFPTIWHALFDDPVEIANLQIRSELMLCIGRRVTDWGITQTEAAGRLGISQPRLNSLLRGNFNRFSIDSLINIALKAGLSVNLDLKEAA